MSCAHLSSRIYFLVDVYSITLTFEKTAVFDVTFRSNAAGVPLFVVS